MTEEGDQGSMGGLGRGRVGESDEGRAMRRMCEYDAHATPGPQ